MPESVAVRIRDLVLIPELSPRERLHEETVIRYMESFASLPPVRVQARTNVVVDGFHRVEAAVRLGMESVPAIAEEVPDEELRLIAGLLNARHGHPLSRSERNRLAVALVSRYGKLREESAELLGISLAAVTLALREHQFNEQISERLGVPVQVINSAHVRALYRVGPDQRERLLEAVVSKVDEDGRPYPLTGAELKLLVDRMLDPATPSSELTRLLSDPHARPKGAPAPPAQESAGAFLSEGARPWETEWESPLKRGDGEEFDRVRSVDEQIERAGGGVRERPISGRAGDEAGDLWLRTGGIEAAAAGGPAARDDELAGLREGIYAAGRALAEIATLVQPPDVRRQVEAVVALLRSLQPG